MSVEIREKRRLFLPELSLGCVNAAILLANLTESSSLPWQLAQVVEQDAKRKHTSRRGPAKCCSTSGGNQGPICETESTRPTLLTSGACHSTRVPWSVGRIAGYLLLTFRMDPKIAVAEKAEDYAGSNIPTRPGERRIAVGILRVDVGTSGNK